MIDFANLNIDLAPVEQSLVANSYGLVVASIALYTNESLYKIILHVRKFFKLGGKVLLFETIKDRLDMQLILGTLLGWWLSQEPF